MTRGSIELARRLCYEIAGPTDEDDMYGSGYGSVDIAEILSAEVERLRVDAARWRWFVAHAALRFRGPPSYDAVIRLRTPDSHDSTLEAIVDRGIAEEQQETP